MLEENQNANQTNAIDIEQLPPYAKHPNFKDWLFRLTLFLIGFLGLDILTIILQLIFNVIFPEWFVKDSPTQIVGLSTLNAVRYVFLTIGLIALLLPRLKIIINKFKSFKTILLGIGFGIALIGITRVYSLVISDFVELEINANEEAAESMIFAYPFLSIIVLGILGPVCEEVTYRYGLFGLFNKKAKILAYIITPLVFALIHFDFTGNLLIELVNMPSYIIAGILLCYVYDKYGFGASVIAHIANNLFAIITILISAQ